MEEINLSEIFQLFWKKKIQILMIMLIFIISGCVYTLKFVTPKYTSTVTMILVANNKEEDKNSTITTSDITVNSKLISTYSKLIKSKTVLQQVIDNLNLEMDENILKNEIEVKSIKNTGLIEITVTDEKSSTSAKIANEIAKVLPEKVKQMYNIDNIQLMNEVEENNKPSNINRKKDMMIFVILGMVVSIIYVVLVSMLDKTIKGTETIEKEFNLPVLTSIPILRRKYEKWREEIDETRINCTP